MLAKGGQSKWAKNRSFSAAFLRIPSGKMLPDGIRALVNSVELLYCIDRKDRMYEQGVSVYVC